MDGDIKGRKNAEILSTEQPQSAETLGSSSTERYTGWLRDKAAAFNMMSPLPDR